MNNRTLSMLSYVTLIGWLIAYFSGKEKTDALLIYHLKQSLGLAIVSILLNIVLYAISYLVPAWSLLSLAGWTILIFWILGMINAGNDAQKPVPVFGKAFEHKFSFIG
ncbi:DUF4870 domain-containing protein [Chitinophaga nivalis]|uniref:DUF4870 domain-containing protein n=1 Tax=Chitinophaga nivalis TaxID=2991709 RepID=A0ABT3IJA9_9BACT|nr:DUF4870 domain-containing protein [Chitinophaga nivalis]MCW3466414.1 DUF4870 domain-containing protein [Chitinophaga nivalis]MCW3483895.1 DUF4870 domain-containing protein [Chitinophaga nivalis]